MFTDRQEYIGLSRATILEELFILYLDFNIIKANPKAIIEYYRLKEKIANFTIGHKLEQYRDLIRRR